MAAEAERAAQQNNMKELYDTTRKLCNKQKKQTIGVRKKDGTLVTEEEQVMQRWKEHFQEILNITSEEA